MKIEISVQFFFFLITIKHLGGSRSLSLHSHLAAEDDCTSSAGSGIGRTTPNPRLAEARASAATRL